MRPQSQRRATVSRPGSASWRARFSDALERLSGRSASRTQASTSDGTGIAVVEHDVDPHADRAQRGDDHQRDRDADRRGADRAFLLVLL